MKLRSKKRPLAPVDRNALPWLWLSTLAATLPHAWHQPVWLSALSGLLLALTGWRWLRQLPAWPGWLPPLVAIAGASAIWFEFRTLFGREPGVALLVLFMAMKFLELRSQRDAMVIVALGNFLLLTHYFQSQDMLTGAWLLLAFWLLTASLVRLHAGDIRWRDNLREAGVLALQAVPFMLVLFLLFPRVQGPLWGLPADAHKGLTGLSDTMAPGSVSELAQSDAIAFRVRFDGPPPNPAQRYWRGPVMERFDGQRWRPLERPQPAATVTPLGPTVDYEITLEGHNQRWLLALDAPVKWPADAVLDGRMTLLASKPLTSRQRHRLGAAPMYHFNRQESPATLALNRQLPAGLNPRSNALARQWKEELLAPERIVEAALRHFREQNFSYTLRPPLLGRDGIDQFLFESRRGFCEHYAAAFVVLMRAAGIPARVVGGYQGGEINPRDGYLTVRQSEAHAWAEVWLENRGWVRVDPTAAVAPERIEQGIASALPAGEPLPALLRLDNSWLRDLNFRWEALNNAWNQHVLGYDLARQRELLSRLGWPDADWPELATGLAGAMAMLLGLTALVVLFKRPRLAPETVLWHRALRRLRVDCRPGETPGALLARLQVEQAASAARLAPVVEHYLRARYGPPDPNALTALRAAVDRLPRWRIL